MDRMHAPTFRSQHVVAGLLGALLVAGCQPAMTAPAAPTAINGHATVAGTAAEWPLTFKRHLFGAVCFGTRGCEVIYDDRDHGTAVDTPPVSEIPAQRYDALMIARYGDLPNFATPARLRWRSSDGSEHAAKVDLAEIFRDGLIRHKTPREDIAGDVSMGFTHVVLEIDDRTVNVYTRTMIPTRREQIPGNPHSFFRDDLIKVYTRTY